MKYPIMENFYTLQGEGAWQGSAAYFIRLGGCDVGCHWCDVKESWDASLHPVKTIPEIREAVSKHKTKLVVITGGEPLMHNCQPLTEALSKAGYQLNIETSGAHNLTGKWDWICFSPKKFKAPKETFYQVAHELKIIVYNRSDFRWAEEHAAKMHPGCQLYLQPEWSVKEKITPQIIDYIKENPRWRLSLQTHKYINIP